MKDLSQRKQNRLKCFDYSSNGVYFITIGTYKHECMLWGKVGATIGRPQDKTLSEYGVIIDETINNISKYYPCVNVIKYVIMPNHIHLILQIERKETNGRPMVAPTISTVVQQMKGIVTKKIGFSIWQKSFHDHIIRNEKEFQKIWEYVENNPLKWDEDCFFNGQ